MSKLSRRDIVFLLLAGIFIMDALLGELTGGKLFQVGPFVMSIGILPWPVVFLATDIVNEFYGRRGVQRLTLTTIGLILLAFGIVFIAIHIPAAVGISPVSDDQFRAVFGQSLWIIAGSVAAFAISQLVDVSIFWFVRARTGGKWLWMRATGSTAISQLVDSFVITGIAFWLPGKLSAKNFLNMALTNYSYKLLIAIALTPLIYAAHGAIEKFLGTDAAHELEEHAAADSLAAG